MGKLYDQRVAIKNSIVAANLGLAETDIVVERRADIINNVKKIVAQRDDNGIALTIEPSSGTNTDLEAEELDFDVSLKVKLWVLPVYNQDTMPEDDIFEPLMKHLHHLQIEDGSHYYNELRVAGFRDVPDPEFLVMEIPLKCRQII